MAHQSDEEQLTSAWRALSGESSGSGWRVIGLFTSDVCVVKAGRRSSGNEECLLVGIANAPSVNETSFPRGQGFLFVPTDLPRESSDLSWYALVRQQGGQLPLFSLMAADLVSMLRRSVLLPGGRVFSLLLARIRAWQDFMRRDRSGVLSPEEELGLIGELTVLADLHHGALPLTDAVDSWVGPENGLHDFILGSGGIEVKCTSAPVGFVAKVFSLAQLDAGLLQPLYLAAVRVVVSPIGKSLPEVVDQTINFTQDDVVRARLSAKLLSAGYLDMFRESYSRQFTIRSFEYRLIDEDAPVLTRSNVPSAVLDARYSFDVESLPLSGISFRDISETLGL